MSAPQMEYALECYLDKDFLRCWDDQQDDNNGGSVNVECAANQCRLSDSLGRLIECNVDRLTTKPVFDENGTTIALRVWVIIRTDVPFRTAVGLYPHLSVRLTVLQAVGDPSVVIDEGEFGDDGPTLGTYWHMGTCYPWDPWNPGD